MWKRTLDNWSFHIAIKLSSDQSANIDQLKTEKKKNYDIQLVLSLLADYYERIFERSMRLLDKDSYRSGFER